MDGEKRKHKDDGDVESKSVKPEEEKDAVVTEEEVEEFFTILRRIHEAARQYGQPDGEGGRKLTTSKRSAAAPAVAAMTGPTALPVCHRVTTQRLRFMHRNHGCTSSP